MFRTVTVIFCLISFCPAAVNAQELAAISQSIAATDQSMLQSQLNTGLKLTLAASSYPADKVLVSENRTDPDASRTVEKNKQKQGIGFKEWAEIHWGDYRWVWWAGAAGALVALHAFAFGDH